MQMLTGSASALMLYFHPAAPKTISVSLDDIDSFDKYLDRTGKLNK